MIRKTAWKDVFGSDAIDLAPRPTRPSHSSLANMLICSGLPHFATHLGFFAKPTRLPQIEVLPVTRCTVRHMLPVLILLDILEPR